jgi:hypothetical protein
MEIDKYQQAWRSQAAQTEVKIDIDLLSKAVQKSHRGFQSTINWRDCREVGVSVLLLIYWFYMGLTTAMPWTWWLTVPALIWSAGFILVDRKRHPQRPSEPGEPLAFYAKEALSQVEHQIWLLRNVFWWYLLPYSISLMAFFLQVSWNGSSSWWDFSLHVAFWSLFILVIYGAVYWANQYAVRNTLEPRRQELSSLVAGLEDDAVGTESEDFIDLVSRLADPSQNFTWEHWADKWNRTIPSWLVAASIILPTIAGAGFGLYSGLWIRIPEMGPVFFQAVVGAVIPFEIALFSHMYLAFRRKNRMQAASANGEPNMSASEIVHQQSLDRKAKRLPRAPALVILVLILFLSLMVLPAIIAFFIHFTVDHLLSLFGKGV